MKLASSVDENYFLEADSLLAVFFFTFVPCIFILSNFIYSPTDALVSCLKNNIKIYINIYIKTTPTCFGVTVTPSSGSALIHAY